MRHSNLIGLLFVAAVASMPSTAFQYNLINAKTLKKKLQTPCTFVHFWAAWCEICIKELPGLLRFLESKKTIERVVVDLSHDLAQEKFSKPWLTKQSPDFTTYRKGKAHDHDLVASIAKGWQGGLPYSLLFVKGKNKQVWNGSISEEELNQALLRHCGKP